MLDCLMLGLGVGLAMSVLGLEGCVLGLGLAVSVLGAVLGLEGCVLETEVLVNTTVVSCCVPGV